jgi:nitrogen fixation/metabolism regulation signal transduction histidine kinase
VTQRSRFIVYLVAVHVLMAGAGILLFREHPLWLFGAEAVLAVSLAAGFVLTRRLFRTLAVARSGAQLIRDHDFTSRLRPVGQPEIDDLIAVYNRMVDSLREERTRLQEQHHFLAHILRVSPSGIVVLDFDRRIETVNPAAARLLGVASAPLSGRRLDALPSPLANALSALPANTTEVRSAGDARRMRCHHGTFIDRGFPRSFFCSKS